MCKILMQVFWHENHLKSCLFSSCMCLWFPWTFWDSSVLQVSPCFHFTWHDMRQESTFFFLKKILLFHVFRLNFRVQSEDTRQDIVISFVIPFCFPPLFFFFLGVADLPVVYQWERGHFNTPTLKEICLRWAHLCRQQYQQALARLFGAHPLIRLTNSSWDFNLI